jgi:hypothetical protein
MPPYEATRARAEEAMMARVVTGGSADHSAFEAASGLSRTGKNYRRKSDRRCYDQNRVH